MADLKGCGLGRDLNEIQKREFGAQKTKFVESSS